MSLSFEFDPAAARIVDAATQRPVAHGVDPAHGFLLAAAPLFRVGCVEIEKILRLPTLTLAERVRASTELLAVLLESAQREQIRALPEPPAR